MELHEWFFYALNTLQFENGYIEDGIYYFYTKDHLGINRIIAIRTGWLVQSTQYYPFGMVFADGANPSTTDALCNEALRQLQDKVGQ